MSPSCRARTSETRTLPSLASAVFILTNKNLECLILQILPQSFYVGRVTSLGPLYARIWTLLCEKSLVGLLNRDYEACLRARFGYASLQMPFLYFQRERSVRFEERCYR